MRLTKSIAALFGTLALAACTVEPPTGPEVVAMPGPGKTLPQFQGEDATCRGYALQQTGFASPSQAATQSALGSAAVGTVVGAAAGAAIGAASGNPGAGAAIGAGSGLVLGSAVGAGNAEASEESVQQRYDVAYAQCMTTQGDKVQAPPAAAPGPAYGYGGYPPGYYGGYGYGPYPYDYYGPSYYPYPAGVVVFGGFGHDHHHHR